MADLDILNAEINQQLGQYLDRSILAHNELTIEVSREHLRNVCLKLRDESSFDFKQLMDVCGVDYLHYGLGEWETEASTEKGFERGVDREKITNASLTKHRFASVYHLLSLQHNHRLRLRVFLNEEEATLPSVTDIWPSANWFEREAFDLFGIMYEGHPDLRRILTDYGFIGHPFRKDFPLIGKVEARYDGASKRVVYEPCSIKPRILEPKVIRRDNRYEEGAS